MKCIGNFMLCNRRCHGTQRELCKQYSMFERIPLSVFQAEAQAAEQKKKSCVISTSNRLKSKSLYNRLRGQGSSEIQFRYAFSMLPTIDFRGHTRKFRREQYRHVIENWRRRARL